ncbi:MAG: ABC transporter substrate-binding protein [Gemmatimonadota bacterium]|nr:ABC transporter substrate-binding protein [Gemmatimonadota bacterium]
MPFRWRNPAACLAWSATLAAALAIGCVSARGPAGPTLSDAPITRAAAAEARDAYERGVDAARIGDHETALELFTRVVEEYPASEVSGLALYWRGRTLYQLGEDASAAAELDRYLSLGSVLPFRESAALLLANSRYGVREFQASLDAALEIREASPERIEEFLDLSRDLLDRLPRSAIERAVGVRPPRNFLAPFYLQASRWAYADGDTARARELARRVSGLPALPGEVIAEAGRLAGPETGPRAAGARPRLGFIAPEDGRFARVADEIRRGIELALEDVNEGRRTPVDLEVRFSSSDPDSIAEIVRSLARRDRVQAILGPLVSEIALRTARIASQEGVPMVSPTATDANLLEVDPNVFTVNALDGSIGHTIGMYAARTLEKRRLAILAVDNPYGRIQADAFASAVASVGGRVAIRRDYRPGTTEFTEHLGAIVRSQAQGVFLSTNRPDEALRILNQMAFFELGTILPLGTDAWNDTDFFRQGRGFLRGYFADTFSRDPRVTRWNSFSERYADRYGGPPTNRIAAWGYDATRLAVERFPLEESPGATEPYRGASALFRFTPDGIRRAVVVHRIEAAEPEAVEW